MTRIYDANFPFSILEQVGVVERRLVSIFDVVVTPGNDFVDVNT